jgi:hemoglobin
MNQETQPTIYERLGGDPIFWKIAEAFYGRVGADPDQEFRSIFPKDLTEPIRNQAEFLIQYFGGPTAYSDRKGHPRLRMRHATFPIDRAARDRWMTHMQAALIEAQVPEPERSQMAKYFEETSLFLMNRHPS